MEIVQKLISKDKYSIKCPYPMKAKGICIHNTANDAQARNEIEYMKSNNNEVSFHIAVDNVEAVQGLPLDRNAWASGDGSNGEGNRNYIHIEICFSKSGGERFNQAERNTAKVVAKLLKENNWTIKDVKKHQDFAKKYCPHRTLDYGWYRFLKMVEVELRLLGVKPIEEVEKITKEYKEKGVFTCTEDKIYFRNKPIISSDNPITGDYKKGETVNYDYVVMTNKYVYISWISSSARVRRYMPVRDLINKEVWGTFK